MFLVSHPFAFPRRHGMEAERDKDASSVPWDRALLDGIHLSDEAREAFLHGKRRNLMRKWSRQEDERVEEMVNTFGPRCWARVAKELPGRTGKQVRRQARRGGRKRGGPQPCFVGGCLSRRPAFPTDTAPRALAPQPSPWTPQSPPPLSPPHSAASGGSTICRPTSSRRRGHKRKRRSSSRPMPCWAANGWRSPSCCQAAPTTASRTIGTWLVGNPPYPPRSSVGRPRPPL